METVHIKLNKQTMPRKCFSQRKSIILESDSKVSYIRLKISRQFFSLILKHNVANTSCSTVQIEFCSILALQMSADVKYGLILQQSRKYN